MPEFAYIIAAIIVVALVIYLLSGGADFGGGIWALFAAGPRKKAQRRALSDAIAPIWEANHVWLILVVVLLFVCFPAAFAAIMTALHIPIVLMLIGIVLRGSAFVFESYAAGATRLQRRSGYVFVVASVVTPFLLGVVGGAVASGTMTLSAQTGHVQTDFVSEWLHPFAAAIGAFTLALCAYLSAIYMTVEADTAELRDDFRKRGLWAAGVVGVCALISVLLARDGAAHIYEGLLGKQWSLPFQAVTGFVALVAIWGLWTRRFKLARAAAMMQVAMIVVGWALSQYPYLVYPAFTIEQAGAPVAILEPVLIALGVGGILLVPSFWWLYRVFKADKTAHSQPAELPPNEPTDAPSDDN